MRLQFDLKLLEKTDSRVIKLIYYELICVHRVRITVANLFTGK